MTLPDGDPQASLAFLEASITTLREDREHGASWLARFAARALADAAGDSASVTGLTARERARHLGHYALDLARVRPSMAAVANTVASIYDSGWPMSAPVAAESETDAAAALARLRAAAERAFAEWDTAASAITTAARPLLGDGPICTHSRSGTVERVLTALATGGEAGREVIVTTSQPGGEGIETARALGAAGWRVTLVADAAVGLTISQAGCVVLGADSVRADGALVNKAGSYPIALAARAARIPLYVLCESLKIAPTNWPLTLEEMASGEILPQPIPGVTARNVYFDVTPRRLITAFVTERGVLDARAIRQFARAAEHRLAHLAHLAHLATLAATP